MRSLWPAAVFTCLCLLPATTIFGQDVPAQVRVMTLLECYPQIPSTGASSPGPVVVSSAAASGLSLADRGAAVGNPRSAACCAL